LSHFAARMAEHVDGLPGEPRREAVGRAASIDHREGFEPVVGALPPVTDEEVMRIKRICKDIRTGNLLGCAYAVPLVLAVGIVLMFSRKTMDCPDWLCVDCDQPLDTWAFVLLVSQLALFPVRLRIHKSIPNITSVTTPQEATQGLNRLTSSVLYNVARFVRFFVAVWFIVGMVWVQASDDCPKELYHLCFVLIILFLIVAGLALINCCFYAGCLFASRTFRLAARFSLASPLSTDSLPRSGLSRRAIAKLPSKMFHPGSLPPEDAVCAICLAEYIPGEKIRSLGTCVHHFHATCIDQWLESKRNCPLCQTDVVKPKRSGSQPPLNVVPALPVSGAKCVADTASD